MSDEIERIRRDHIADPDGDPNDPHCVMCSDASYPIWPCDAAILLALLAERDAEVARLREAGNALSALMVIRAGTRPSGSWEWYCQACGASWAKDAAELHEDGCEVVSWRAALAARGGES